MKSPVRTRFAPSPTGFLHVGGVRTALFSWLVARQANGKFLLRIEDTDQRRKVDGAEGHIIESLDWLGIKSDEEKIIRQSERLDVYKKWADKLIKQGRAYADPYSPAEVQAFREQAQANKQPFLYRNHRPDNPPVWDGATALRFLSDPKEYVTNDVVMGKIKTGPEVIDDFILIKSDGYPTYNFSHIVDDIEMGVTHVIRGQEFLASLPNYHNLYQALDEQPPIFATVPHILNEHGNKKLSKRDGAKDILEYRKEGYLPEAMVNFLATLGWNDGTQQEEFSVNELIDKFDLARVQKSGARFDERRLTWLNGVHIRKIPIDKLYKILSDFDKTPGYWPTEAFQPGFDDTYRMHVLGVVQERLKFFAELKELTQFFFVEPEVNPNLISSHKQLKKIEKSHLHKLLKICLDSLGQSDFSTKDLTNQLNNLLEKTGEKPAVLFSLIRIAITQAPSSPALVDTLHVLGKERSINRIKNQVENL